jgi:hypothetical protein
MIGSLMYLTTMRPDTLCSVSMRSLPSFPMHFSQIGCETYYEIPVLQSEFGLWYSSSSVLSLCGYCDFARC